MELENILIIGLLGSVTLGGIYYKVRRDFERIEKRKREFYEIMESIPAEHRSSVEKVLRVLEKQDPHDNISYRIRSFLKDYNRS